MAAVMTALDGTSAVVSPSCAVYSVRVYSNELSALDVEKIKMKHLNVIVIQILYGLRIRLRMQNLEPRWV